MIFSFLNSKQSEYSVLMMLALFVLSSAPWRGLHGLSCISVSKMYSVFRDEKFSQSERTSVISYKTSTIKLGCYL